MNTTNKQTNESIYYKKFEGHKISEYGLEHGFLDYRTLAQCFDAVLCNNITEIDEFLFDNIESGSFWEYFDQDGNEISEEEHDQILGVGGFAEERQKDIFQFFIVSDNALYLLKEAGEIVFYSEKLDVYVWDVTHYGTCWDYVLTNIKLRKKGE